MTGRDSRHLSPEIVSEWELEASTDSLGDGGES